MDHGNALLKVIEFLPEAALVVDREGKVIVWNRAMEKMTGVPGEKILGKGEYAYAVPFYGKPVPMLIDLVRTRGSELSKCYDSTEWKGNTLFAECWIGNLPDWTRGKEHISMFLNPLFKRYSRPSCRR